MVIDAKGGDYMQKKKHILSAIAVLILGLTPMAAGIPAYAASTTTSPQSNFFTGLVQFISQKFHLDQAQVQSAVNDYKTQHMQQMQQTMQDREKKRLDTLVSQGKITSSQEQQILDEQSKLRSEYNPANLKNETAAQRKADRQKEQAEIQAWSSSTGIDAKYLGFRFGMRMHGGGWKNEASVTPTPGS